MEGNARSEDSAPPDGMFDPPHPGHDGEVETVVTRLREYLWAIRSLTGYGLFAWRVGPDSFTEDSELERALGPAAAPLRVPGQATAEYLRLVHPSDRDGVREAVRAALAGEVPEYRCEHRILFGDGDAPTERWISTLARVEVDDAGAPARLIGVFADVTDRRVVDLARARAQKFEAVATLTSGVAHDFNNIIGAILSYTTVARAELRAGASPAESLSQIERGARRAEQVVNRLLSYTRERPPRRELFFLGDVVEEATSLMRASIGRAVELGTEVPPVLPPMRGDPTELHQVIVNLIANARQALDDRPGRIDVTLDLVALQDERSGPSAALLLPGTYLQLRVTDDGPGIDPHVMPRIFDPFFTTKRVGEGTGLGLAAAHGIVQRHGGEIFAENCAGGGARFTVLLPAEAPAQPAEPTDRDELNGPTILFVDDEEGFAALAERAMPYAGCRVSSYTDPERALEALRAAPGAFDAVVTDLSMPRLSGLQLAKHVRLIRPDIPIVLTSGYMDAEDHAEAEAAGVDTVMLKPCAVDALASEALRLLRRRPGVRAGGA